MTHIQSGCWCNQFSGFLDDRLVNFTCPRAIYNGCYGQPQCPNAGYAVLVDGVRRK